MFARVIRASVAYFAVVFAAGFALGAMRVAWLVPAVGERVAELAEIPLMLVVSALAARWVLRRFLSPAAAWPRIAAGCLALALLLSLELTFVLSLRGLTFAAYLASRDPVSGTAYLLSLVLFALMPALWLPFEARSRRSAGTRR
jgi:hypothetical protein